jgi:hypothetical protein
MSIRIVYSAVAFGVNEEKRDGSQQCGVSENDVGRFEEEYQWFDQQSMYPSKNSLFSLLKSIGYRTHLRAFLMSGERDQYPEHHPGVDW